MSDPAPDSLPDWCRAHGAPVGAARVRSVPEDFVVDEEVGFSPDGEGQHVLLHIRKRDSNTDWLAGRIAALAGVPRRDVGFAGLKDRRAVTSQWFSVDLRGASEPDWGALESPEIRVLTAERHGRKLRRGALQGNRFELLLREPQGDRPAWEERLERIGADGVPNYFGPQRFGRDGGNIEKARLMLAGRLGRVNRHRRGLYLSAARSYLFNAVLSERVAAGTWARPLPGEMLMLRGRRSRFVAEEIDEDIARRAEAGELLPSGPLWGRGEPASRGEALAVERQALEPYGEWCHGLEKAGLEQERRALRLPVEDLAWAWEGDGVRLRFRLTAGAYATAVLRELLDGF